MILPPGINVSDAEGIADAILSNGHIVLPVGGATYIVTYQDMSSLGLPLEAYDAQNVAISLANTANSPTINKLWNDNPNAPHLITVDIDYGREPRSLPNMGFFQVNPSFVKYQYRTMASEAGVAEYVHFNVQHIVDHELIHVITGRNDGDPVFNAFVNAANAELLGGPARSDDYYDTVPRSVYAGDNRLVGSFVGSTNDAPSNATVYSASGKPLQVGSVVTGADGYRFAVNADGSLTNLTTGRRTPVTPQPVATSAAALEAATGTQMSPSQQYDMASQGAFAQSQISGSGPPVHLASGSVANAGTVFTTGDGYRFIVNENGSVTNLDTGHTTGNGTTHYDPDTNTWVTVGSGSSGGSSGSSSGGSSSSTSGSPSSSGGGGKGSQNDNAQNTSSSSSGSGYGAEPYYTGYGGNGSDPTQAPILLDLDGNGITITGQSSSNVFMDTAGDGQQHRTAWASAGDGVLVRDDGNDGVISRRNEIDFTAWDPTAKSDMQALRDIFDTNHNNQLDSGDAEWSLFKVLVTNADGTTSLQSLSSLGIASIDLISNNQEVELPDGSKILGTTTYAKTGGGTGKVADATLSYDANGYVVTQSVTLNGDGSTTIDNKATRPDGSLASETVSTTSASGLSVTTTFDDDGDGVVDRVQNKVTVINGDGSRTETLSRYDGSGTILTSQQVTDVSADTNTVTISRDSAGSGTYDQVETDVIDGSGDQTVAVTDLNRDESTRDVRITTTSADGLSKTVQTELTGSGAINATTTTTTSVDVSGTRTETRTDYAGSGTTASYRVGQKVTTLSADGSSQTIASDLDGDGLTDVTMGNTIVVNGDGSRTTSQTETNRNATTRDETVTLLSADGLTTTTQLDADGDGNYEQTTIDAKVLNVDGSTTETVTVKDVNGTIDQQTVTTWSADGKTRTINVDSDGDGNDDRIETVAIVSGNSVDTTSIYSPNGGTLLSKTVATTSSDGLAKTVQSDVNGDGTFDSVQSSTTVINVDHSSTTTVLTKNGAGTIQIGKAVTDTSADGLSTTTRTYQGTQANPFATTTDVTVLGGDGSTTETVTSFAGTSNVQTGKQVTILSGDRLATTVKSYLGTNSLPEAVATMVEAADGSKTKTESHYSPTGDTLLSRATTSISSDGLSSVVATDVNGDGVVDQTQTISKLLNSDGTVTVTTRTYAGAGTDDANKVSDQVVTTGGNGLSVTTLSDFDGNNQTDSRSTDVAVLNADGSKIETITTLSGDGTVQTGKTVLTISDDGLTRTQSTYLSDHTTADAVTTDAIVFAVDGSTVETVSAYTGSGALRSKQVTTKAGNGLSSTIAEDLDGDGVNDRQTSVSVNSSGSIVTAVSTFSPMSTLTSKSTTTVSGNGLSTSVVADLDGDTVTDLSLTDAIVVNADGSKAETLSDFKAGGALKDKTVVTTTADGLSVTSQWDGTGGGSFTRSATDVTVINADGSTTETISNLNANGSLHDKIIVTTSADKRSVTTTHDLNGDGTIDQTSAQVQNADGSVTSSNMDGSVLSASGRLYGSVNGQYRTVNATGLSTTTQYDANGDSLAEKQTTDVTVLNVDGSTTRTIADATLSGGTAGSSNPTYTVSVTDQAVIDTSADGRSKTTQWDFTGSGTFTESESNVVTQNTDGSTTETTSYLVGTNLKSREEVWRSADGLTKVTKWDTTGSGVYDEVSTYARVLNSDGSTTETTVNQNASGATLSKTTVTTSKDGLTVTTLLDTDGSGAAVKTRTAVTRILADGTTIVTTSNFNPGGSLHDKTITQTSGDGRTVTTTIDANGDGTTDQTQVFVQAVDGTVTKTITDLGAGGTVKSRATSTTTFDGLQTGTDGDFNGDGAMNASGTIDRVVSDVLLRNADGSSTETTQVKRYYTATPTLIETVTSRTSADGRTQTTTIDVDGNGTVDETSTTVTKINGSTVETVTDNATARANDPGAGDVFWISAIATSMKTVAATAVITTSADQLSKTVAADYDDNGTYEHNEAWKQVIDGSQVATIIDANAGGSIVARGLETISADGLTTELIEDTANGGKINHKEVSLTKLDGSKVKTVTDLNTDGTLQKTVVTTVSANGQTITPTTTNGSGASVTVSTSSTNNWYWGTSETIIVSGASDTIGVSDAVNVVTLNGNNNIINEGGAESLTVNGTGTGKRLQVFNRDNVAMIGSSTVLLNDYSGLTLLGSVNSITMFDNGRLDVCSGSGETLYINGDGSSATISSATIELWNGSSLYLDGSDSNVTLYNNTDLTSSGSNTVTVNGNGTSGTMSHSDIYVWDDQDLVLTGTANNVTLYRNTTLTLKDAGNGIDVSDDLSHIIGDGQTITLHDGFSVDVAGSDNILDVLDHATLTLHGSGNQIGLGNASVILTEAYNNIDVETNGGDVQGDTQNINIWSGITGTVEGTNNGINLDNDSSVTVNDDGNSVYAWGSNTYAMIDNGTVNVEEGAQVSVDGTGNDIDLGQDGQAVVMQDGNTVNVHGTDGYVSMSNGTMNVDDGSGSTLDGSHNAIYMGQDSWVNAIGSYDAFHFQAGFGHDEIDGFDATGTDADDVYIDDTVFANWSTLLSHTTQSGSDVLITQNSGNVITLHDTTKTDLQQSHFHFT